MFKQPVQDILQNNLTNNLTNNLPNNLTYNPQVGFNLRNLFNPGFPPTAHPNLFNAAVSMAAAVAANVTVKITKSDKNHKMGQK